jgi:hypothetical protein
LTLGRVSAGAASTGTKNPKVTVRHTGRRARREPLRDVAYFKAFTLAPMFHTLTWPNGADVAPEFLHDSVKVTA